MEVTASSLGLAKSPINLKVLQDFLAEYPNKTDAELLRNGFMFGFKLMYEGPRVESSCQNLKSVIQNPNEAVNKIMKEVRAGRIAGPFKERPLKNLRLSPIGLVPKKNGSWRLIHHLSFPKGSSLNDYIDDTLCSVKYTSLDKVIDSLSLLGCNTLLGKIDIENAFRILPIHPNDFSLLGFTLNGFYFIDKCLPMGCSLSCALFEKFAKFLEWLVMAKAPNGIVHHYLDDFIFMGKPDTNDCMNLMNAFLGICKALGVPLADDKTVWPSKVLVFLGFELNSILMQLRIPPEKLVKLSELLILFLKKKKTTLQEFQSLIGLLDFCARAIPCSRAFNRRFYDATCGILKPNHHLRLTHSIKEDLKMWLFFIDFFNGSCIFPELNWSDNSVLQLYTDSSGTLSLGCAAMFGKHWVFMQWPKKWCKSPIMADLSFLEFVPIALAFHIWLPNFKGKKIILNTDNEALVTILNKKSSKSKYVMYLLRPFVLNMMLNNIQIKAVHVSGLNNGIADSISRKQWDRFRRLAPDADQQATLVPDSFRNLLSGLRQTNY